jgi:uncharacterized membrane protein YdjX (TVP38/TMEM64 family)
VDHRNDNREPDCLGRLEKVFPLGEDGLRHTPVECLECSRKTECLRRAVTGPGGVAVEEERLARAYRAGMVGFFGRWAKQKELARRLKNDPQAAPGCGDGTGAEKAKVRMGKTLIVMALVLLAASVAVALLVLNSGFWDRLWAYADLVQDREWMRSAVTSAGWAAPLIFMGLQLGQVLFAPIPGEVTGFVGGYIFGAWKGFFFSSIGLTLGSVLNFGIGHFLGEQVVRRMVPSGTYEKYNRMVQYKGVLVIFLLFLIPGFPKDYLCLFLGLTTLPFKVFFVISTIGRAPGTLALSLQGASIYHREYAFFLIVTGLCLLFALGGYLLRQPLYRWMDSLNNRKKL